MMTYEQFKENTKKHFIEYMPDEYKGYHVEFKTVAKVNQVLDGFVIQAPGATVSPQIYLNVVYEVYLETESFPKAMHIMCEILVDEITRTDDLDARSIIENAEERIVFQLINTEKNKELLKTVPHRNFLDLSIIFVVSVNVSELNSYGSIRISNHIAETQGWTEEQLFQMAWKNTKTLFPFEIDTMRHILMKQLLDDGMTEPVAEAMIHAPEGLDDEMWILTNEQKFNGGIILLYEEELHNLAEKLESDLYLLPSSRHEIIAVSAKVTMPERLAEMVQQVNEEVVDEKDFLSNSVYRYDRTSRITSLFIRM